MNNHLTNQEQPFDARAVAKRLGVSVYTVKREVRRGALGFYRIGAGQGRLRFSEDHVQRYLAEHENMKFGETGREEEK